MKEVYKPGTPYLLSESDKLKVIKDLLRGIGVHRISRRHNIPDGAIRRYVTIWEPAHYKVNENSGLGNKTVPYYDESYKEMDAWQFPKYTLKDLSVDEIDIYLEDN